MAAETAKGEDVRSLAGLAFLVSAVALVGSVYLTLGMKLKACPLCVYQRTFVMGTVSVLAIGLLAARRYRGVLTLLALPAAVGAVTVGAFHVYLEQMGKLECPAGIFGVGSAPQQSLAVEGALLVVLLVGALRDGTGEDRHRGAAVRAVVLGGLLGYAAIATAPPMPPSPTKPYEVPLDVCRPPFLAEG